MKIASVECLPVHSGWRKNFVFVRVETDAGVIGWGEAYSQYDRDRAIAAQVEELGRYLVGRDPSTSATSCRSHSTTMRNAAARWSSIAPRPGSSRRYGTLPER